RTLVLAVDHRLEISTMVRPAILVLLDPVVAGEPVADDDLRLVGPEDRPGHVRAPVVDDRDQGLCVTSPPSRIVRSARASRTKRHRAWISCARSIARASRPARGVR